MTMTTKKMMMISPAVEAGHVDQAIKSVQLAEADNACDYPVMAEPRCLAVAETFTHGRQG